MNFKMIFFNLIKLKGYCLLYEIYQFYELAFNVKFHDIKLYYIIYLVKMIGHRKHLQNLTNI